MFTWALLLVPLSLALARLFDVAPAWTFASAVLAIVPLAEWIRRATDRLATLAGPQVGGLLNVSFGNAAELVLALFVLAAGHPDVVKAQIIGSIVGNGLLGLGAAILVGSVGRAAQTFDPRPAGLLSSLLILSLVGLLVPAFFEHTERAVPDASGAAPLAETLSLGVSCVLVLVYLGNLAYTLRTHRDVFAPSSGPDEAREKASGDGRGRPEPGATWSLPVALGVLVGATVVTALEAELVSDALEATADGLGVTTWFEGVLLVAVYAILATAFFLVTP